MRRNMVESGYLLGILLPAQQQNGAVQITFYLGVHLFTGFLVRYCSERSEVVRMGTPGDNCGEVVESLYGAAYRFTSIKW